MGYNYKVMDAVTGLKRYYNDRRRADVVCDIKKRSRVERAKRHKIIFFEAAKGKREAKAHPLNTISGDFGVRFGHKMTLMTAE